ncbi:MAG: hypothetical protein NTV82_02340 [Candidatus Aminicenantes bacterium]|nr:hypothetical protein [Candidatus Aminicenantes bacterium]
MKQDNERNQQIKFEEYGKKYKNMMDAKEGLKKEIGYSIKRLDRETFKKFGFTLVNLDSKQEHFEFQIFGRNIRQRISIDIKGGVGYWHWILPEYNHEKENQTEKIIFNCIFDSEKKITKADKICELHKEKLFPFFLECIYDFCLAVDEVISERYKGG